VKRLFGLLVVVLMAIGAAAVYGRGSESEPPVFASSSRPGTPGVPDAEGAISTTWFCGGVPALGMSESGEYGGEVVVTNPSELPVRGSVTVLSIDQPPLTVPVVVEPRDQTAVDLDELLKGNYVSSVVEVDQPGVTVEQRSLHPAGDAVSTCANTTSSEWYVADASTPQGSDARLLISNPYQTPAIVDIAISTAAGPRTPNELQGYVIPAQSLRVVNLEESGFRDEPVIGVSVVASSGRIVVAKDQHFLGGGRLGHVTSLGAPSLSDEWWFADGEKGSGVSERLVMFNPTDSDLEVDVVMLGVADAIIDPTTLTVPSREVVVFDTAGILGLPDGRHGTLVSTLSESSLVVERILTRPAGDSISTSVLLGAQGDVLLPEWFVSVTPEVALEGALVILNVSPNIARVDVFSIGPGGREPVTGLEGLELAANGTLSIDLVDAISVGRPVIVVGDQSILVERRLERNSSGNGLSAVLGLPEKS
jgi:hypothetical protein